MADSVDSDDTSDEVLDPSCDPCKNEWKYVRVASYCPTCVEFYCKQCERSHSNLRITKKHRLQYGSDMPSCEADKPPKYEECNVHANILRDLFCCDHFKMICGKCREEHSECLIKHFTDICKILKTSHVQNLETTMVDIRKDAMSTKGELERNVTDFNERKRFMLKEAATEYKKIISQVEKKFKITCELIEKKCSDHVLLLTQKISELSDQIQKYDLALSTIQQAQKSKLDINLFIKMQNVVENISESMLKEHETIKDLKLIDTVFVVDGTWKEYLANDKEIGRVKEVLLPSPPITPMKQVVFPTMRVKLFKKNVTCRISKSSHDIIFGSIEIAYKSSYCYGFVEDLASDLFQQCTQYWPSSHPVKAKTTTAILIAPDGETLVGYGYEAEQKYADLTETGEYGDYYYFPNFARDVENELCSVALKNMMLEDVTGKTIPARTLYIHAMKYLYEKLSQHTIDHPLVEEIDMPVLVVIPSLFKEDDISVIREAAYKAGIQSKSLSFVPEAHAISAFCRSYLRTYKDLRGKEKIMIINFREHNLEVIVDEITQTRPCALQVAVFDDEGNSQVNDAYKELLETILGKAVFQSFVKAKPDQWQNMLEEFDNKKGIIDTKNNATINFRIPQELFSFYEEVQGKSLYQALETSNYAKDVTFTGRLIHVSSTLVRRLFDVPAIKTVMLIKQVLLSRHEDKINTVLMTGELATIREFQTYVQTSFPNLNVIFPCDPNFAALKGAVILGYTHRKGN